MGDAPRADQTLLDRLNALKPTSVNLDPSAKKSIAASTIEPAKPPSREDALSKRLKGLRSRNDEKDASVTPAVGAISPAAILSAENELVERIERHPAESRQETLVAGARDVDPLLDTDDQTLEELLADLALDNQWLEDSVAQKQKEEDEHERVLAMMSELGAASKADPTSGSETGPARGLSTAEEKEDDDSDDDSEGDRMGREADDVLAQALDEAAWEKGQNPQASDGEPSQDPSSERQSRLPAVKPVISTNLDSDPFNLPTVPTELQDQPVAEDDDDTQFVDSIAARMAALRPGGKRDGSLPSVPTSQVDELGLPGVPTFAPGDRPVKGVVKRAGYSDEDMKNWCIVCLEDGTVRCLGCDDETYCARCWKEMHVGPRAGYEERGHQWEKYTPPK